MNLCSIVVIFVSQIVVSLCFKDIPPRKDGALTARYIVHNSDYTSISTVSSIPSIAGYPFVSITSISDGPVQNGTGVTYMYLPEIDFTGMDVEKDNRVSLMMSLIEGNYCTDNKYDPEDPRCSHVMMSGRFVKVKNGTEEHKFAQDTLFQRHPIMSSWPADHGFFIAKVDFEFIAVQDMFGGPLIVKPADYFAVTPKQLYKYKNKLLRSNIHYSVNRI
ncbi:protein CREG1 [Chrysoperla carnea]|uniref:protein CREG1 n=1 Tax=Chrysoperla carnea TaxID=189513 RepID=UPI001D06FF0B|nr:protein CREG1 [Chrysoperla carnea]